MSRRRTIRITQRASRQIEDVARWWKTNRHAAPNAVEEEIERAFALLRVEPGVGPVAHNLKLAGVRRIHLNRIHYHLYYRLKDDAVEILAMWHTSRGRAPKI